MADPRGTAAKLIGVGVVKGSAVNVEVGDKTIVGVALGPLVGVGVSVSSGAP